MCARMMEDALRHNWGGSGFDVAKLLSDKGRSAVLVAVLWLERRWTSYDESWVLFVESESIETSDGLRKWRISASVE